jgi:hypothetical protein
MAKKVVLRTDARKIKGKDGQLLKTTVAIEREVWEGIHIVAIKRRQAFQEIVNECLKAYLKSG